PERNLNIIGKLLCSLSTSEPLRINGALTLDKNVIYKKDNSIVDNYTEAGVVFHYRSTPEEFGEKCMLAHEIGHNFIQNGYEHHVDGDTEKAAHPDTNIMHYDFMFITGTDLTPKQFIPLVLVTVKRMQQILL
ncbi:hypothetical protein ACFL35_19335, partial [Candidatus Riflebacteria bacterium]